MKTHTYEINMSCGPCRRFGTAYETIQEDVKSIYIGCAGCRDNQEIFVKGVYEFRYRSVPGGIEIHIKRLP